MMLCMHIYIYFKPDMCSETLPCSNQCNGHIVPTSLNLELPAEAGKKNTCVLKPAIVGRFVKWHYSHTFIVQSKWRKALNNGLRYPTAILLYASKSPGAEEKIHVCYLKPLHYFINYCCKCRLHVHTGIFLIRIFQDKS